MRFYKGLMTIILMSVSLCQGYAQYDVLPTTGRGELFHDYLIRDLDSLTAWRDAAVAEGLASPETVMARQNELRSRYLKLLGNLPDKTPLNAVVVDSIGTADGYYIETIHYQSVPDHHVTADFYIPDTSPGPFPAVIFLCGHYPTAKTWSDYQNLSILFARNGIACLIADPICQYERYQMTNANGALSMAGQSGTAAHSRLDQGLVDCGSSIVAYMLWDSHRGVDYLYSRSDIVDTARIGCLGHSGGGAQASYLLAFDKRLKVGSIVNYIVNEPTMFNPPEPDGGPQTASQNLSFEGEMGIDQPDYVEMFAPKPYLLISTTSPQDNLFPAQRTQITYDEAKLFWDKLGAADALAFFQTSDQHDYTMQKRETTVRWFSNWFLGKNDTILEEGQTVFNPVDTLYVTDTKNVMTSFENEKSVTDLNIELSESLAAERSVFWTQNARESCLDTIRKLIRYEGLDEALVYETVEEIDRDYYTIEKGKITYSYHVPVTSLLFKENDVSGKMPAVLYVDGRGKKTDAGESGIVEKVYVDSGYIVMSIDVRGFGETSDGGKNESKHNNKEHRNAVISLYEGKTLPGQRVQDIEKAMEILCSREDVDTSDITIVGIDRASVAVLHAAALDTRINKVVIRKAAETPWLDVVADPTIRDQMTHEVPGALMYYDISSLISGGIAPREVEFAEEPVISTSTLTLQNNTDPGFQNFPNPFSDRSVISYTLKSRSDVSLDVYGADGRKVYSAKRPSQAPGSHQIMLNAKDFLPGVYIYNMYINREKVASNKLLVTGQK